MLDCNPPLNDTRELIGELNKSNGLFKFVRTMREKFQEFAAPGMALYLALFFLIFLRLVKTCGERKRSIFLLLVSRVLLHNYVKEKDVLTDFYIR